MCDDRNADQVSTVSSYLPIERFKQKPSLKFGLTNFSVTHVARWRREQASRNGKREAPPEYSPDLSQKPEIKNEDKAPLPKLFKLAPKIAPRQVIQ